MMQAAVGSLWRAIKNSFRKPPTVNRELLGKEEPKLRGMRSWWWAFGIVLAAPVFLGRAQSEGRDAGEGTRTTAVAGAPEALRLSLEESLRLGLANNPQLRAAEAQVRASQGKEISARANFFPKLTASGALVRSNTLTEFKVGDPIALDTSFPVANTQGDPAPPDHIHKYYSAGFEMSNTREGNIYNAKLEAQMPLFTGGRIVNGYQAARLETRVQEEDLRRMELDTVFQVKQAFYGVLLAREMVEVVDKSFATMEAHYRRVQDLYRQGMVSNLDLLQVEAQLSSIRPQQILVHNGLELSKVRLLAVLNLDLETPLQLEGELAYASAPVEETPTLKQTAAQSRPELKGLDLRYQQADKLKKIARAGYLPTVGAFANYQWNRGQELPPNDTIWRDGWQAGLSVSIPLFDGLATRGEMKHAQGLKDQIEMSQAALQAGIEAEVTASALTLNASAERIAATDKTVQAAEKNYKVAEDRYAVGLVNHLDVLDAEVSLTRAQADYLQAVHDYLLAQASLDKAIGRREEVAP